MPRLPDTLRTYAREARNAFVHAPLEVLLGLLMAITFSIAIRQTAGEEWWLRLAAGVTFALPLVFALSVLRARRAVAPGLSWLGSALVLAGAAAFAVWMVDPDLTAERWRWAALVAAGFLLLSLAPVPGRGARERVRHRMWAFDITLLLRVAGVALYGGLLFAALAGAVAAVTALFGLNTPDKLYADLAGAVFFALVPWVIVGGLPSLAAAGTEEPGGGMGERWRAASLLGRFLYAPVLGVYLVILYAYTAKVLLTGEIPKNLLSPIILAAGLAGFIGGVLLEPLQRDPERTGVARLVRLFPLLLLPLLPLAIWAVGVRLTQYGWTEFRYLRFALLLALVLLAILGTVRLLRRRAPLLMAVPAMLAAVLLLSAMGPWSAVGVSERDQQARLRDALAQAGLLEAAGQVALPDSAAPPRVVSKNLFERIASSAAYLYDAHGPAALRPLVARPERFANGWELTRALRLEAGCRPEEVRYAAASLPDSAAVPGLPAGTLHRLRLDRRGVHGPEPAEAAAGPLRLRASGTSLVVSAAEAPDEWRASVELSDLVRRVAERSPDGCGPVRRPDSPQLASADALHPLVDAAGRARGALVLTSLAVHWDSAAAALTIGQAEAIVVLP